MAMVITGIVTVSPDPDVWVSHLVCEKLAFEGALKMVGHGVWKAPDSLWVSWL
tara:strand:- start:420 stop:578 length:159 start_codon:yes stop_codon:yes gene_type:complete